MMIKDWGDIKKIHQGNFYLFGLGGVSDETIERLMSSFRFRIDLGSKDVYWGDTKYRYARIFAEWMGRKAGELMYSNGRSFLSVTHTKDKAELLFTDYVQWNSGNAVPGFFLRGMRDYVESKSDWETASEFMENIEISTPFNYQTKNKNFRYFDEDDGILVCYDSSKIEDMRSFGRLIGELADNARIRRNHA